MGSELGALYIFPSVETFDHYMTGRAGANGRLEVETGSAYRPWMPGGTWSSVFFAEMVYTEKGRQRIR